ncbi:unnamed protein product [Brassica napus]|uniref:(rape) hypothetical protein n=1 Tax=Brassica napus TaxID=3708 RepID=A0A679K8S5_BRANA|nr:Unknown [Brassica napus]CAA8392173.1 Unknown [Brassica napus]CAA8403829.1 Unknown [Brassica napus]CAF2064012.1 unnamed protein product [Brassica napus]
MSDHQILEPSLLDDLFHIPAETIVEEFREKDDTFRAQSESKGKEVVIVLHDENVHGSSSGAAKKQERNANERLRRMRLHASYLTLGTLLPDQSSSSKKKWCAPSIMDRVVTYIPKLLNEVEELTIRKKKLAEAIESEKSQRLERQDPQTRAISVLELGESGDEVVVQISMKKEKEDEFSNLLNVMEMQGSSILSASTSLVCRHQRVVCYNLHVKMDEKPCEGDDYITVLKNNITSSLS